jgi:ABC-type transporter Mla subunit MlaD
VDGQSRRIEEILQQMGEAVIATTETVERLAVRVDSLAHQVQQQGYQIFALSDSVQTLAENQDNALEHLAHLTDALRRLVAAIDDSGEL